MTRYEAGMKVLEAVTFFVAVSALRLVLYVAGWFALPLLFKPFYGERRQDTLWQTYVDMAWRNPTNGMAGWFEQPVPEPAKNPDHMVRRLQYKQASRWLVEDIYWEYWYLRQIDFHLFGLGLRSW